MMKISNLLENDGISSPPVQQNVREMLGAVWHLGIQTLFISADETFT